MYMYILTIHFYEIIIGAIHSVTRIDEEYMYMYVLVSLSVVLLIAI